MKCPHSLIEREEAATVDGICPLCPRPPFDIDKVAEEIGRESRKTLDSTLRNAEENITETAIAILNRAINGGEK
jgi:hypothetical protein